jgi:hypothetical protein
VRLLKPCNSKRDETLTYLVALRRRLEQGFQQSTSLLSREERDQATSDGSTPNPKQQSPTMA